MRIFIIIMKTFVNKLIENNYDELELAPPDHLDVEQVEGLISVLDNLECKPISTKP